MAVALAPNGEGLFDIYSWRKIRLHANLGARLLEVDLEYIVALADFNRSPKGWRVTKCVLMGSWGWGL